jgi:hypothetical protein
MAEVERLDPSVELALVDRTDHDVVRTGFEEVDPRLDVVERGDGEDDDVGELGDAADLAAHLGEGAGWRHGVEDDYVRADGGGQQLVGILDPREGATSASEDLAERLATGIAEQHDSGFGHGAPWGRAWTSARGYNRARPPLAIG